MGIISLLTSSALSRGGYIPRVNIAKPGIPHDGHHSCCFREWGRVMSNFTWKPEFAGDIYTPEFCAQDARKAATVLCVGHA